MREKAGGVGEEREAGGQRGSHARLELEPRKAHVSQRNTETPDGQHLAVPHLLHLRVGWKGVIPHYWQWLDRKSVRLTSWLKSKVNQCFISMSCTKLVVPSPSESIESQPRSCTNIRAPRWFTVDGGMQTISMESSGESTEKLWEKRLPHNPLHPTHPNPWTVGCFGGIVDGN